LNLHEFYVKYLIIHYKKRKQYIHILLIIISSTQFTLEEIVSMQGSIQMSNLHLNTFN